MASDQELLDLLHGKGIKTLSKELEELNGRLSQTANKMTVAFNLGASRKQLEEYADVMEKRLDAGFKQLFNTSQGLNSLEEKRKALLIASTKAISQGNEEEQKRIQILSQQLDKHLRIKDAVREQNLHKMRDAISAAQTAGIPLTQGASRVLGRGDQILDLLGGAGKITPTINSALGGGMAGALGSSLAIGAPLAIAGYAAKTMMGGYNAYSQMMPDVVSGYGSLGRQGMSEINLYGSQQGYSAIDRARMLRQLAASGLQGQDEATAGGRAARSLDQAERLSRSFGVDVGSVIGLQGQASQMTEGSANIEKMLSEAVASGVNRARISDFMEKSVRLGEQIYSSTGAKTGLSDSNQMLAQMVKTSGVKEYASKYGAEILGRVGERIRAVGMGGGDLATQGFMYRALNAQSGKTLTREEFMEAAQGGATAKNIRGMMSQAEREFGEGSTKMAFSQMFGLTFKQTEVLQNMFKGKPVSDDEVKNTMQRFKVENFIKESPEGALLQTIAERNNTQLQIGQRMLPIAEAMLSVQQRIEEAIIPIADAVEWVANKFGADTPAEKRHKEIRQTSDIESLLKYESSGGLRGVMAPYQRNIASKGQEAFARIKDNKTNITMTDLDSFGASLSTVYTGLKDKNSDVRNARQAMTESVIKELKEKRDIQFADKKPSDPQSAAVLKQTEYLINVLTEKLDKSKELEKKLEDRKAMNRGTGELVSRTISMARVNGGRIY